MRNVIRLLLILLPFSYSSRAQLAGPAQAAGRAQTMEPSQLAGRTPFAGAEVFIEPGQTPGQIDHWFALLKENNMDFCRIRLFESYMHKPDGTWDYRLFDQAFKSAEKYGIKIFANIFPATPFEDLGGIKFPSSEEHLHAIALFIKNLVSHFRSSPALYSWVLLNEPGTGGTLPATPFTQEKFLQWKQRRTATYYNSRGYNTLDFDKERFLLYYNTWFLKWIADEIHKYDPGRPLHVNNHQLFQNAAEYDFPAWRKFLTTLGTSAHASWHFGYFDRQQYAVALSANCEMIRSGAGNIPWLTTELQGGNNIYSGSAPMCPTPEEISQWLWINMATGSKGAIFWCLNPRASGFESGEWALLDFQDHPSERMAAAARIAGIWKRDPAVYGRAVPFETGINIIYTRESMWLEKKMQMQGAYYEGRSQGGVMKSALGYFEALSEMGIAANLKEMNEFDFSKADYTGQAIILSHQVSIPSADCAKLENFVKRGGKLIVDGLTGFYDENGLNVMQSGFPLKDLFGGGIREFNCKSNLFSETLTDPAITLPAHLWSGTIQLTTGRAAGYDSNAVIASRNVFGKGEVFWLPSLAGMGGRLSRNYGPLSELLYHELKDVIGKIPFRFTQREKGMLMKTDVSGKNYITILINKSGENKTLSLAANNNRLKGEILFNDKQGTVTNDKITLSNEGTMVIKWSPE
jgi:beta-galactosidase